MGADRVRVAIMGRLAAGVSSVAEISRISAISQPVLSRAIRALERERVVLRMGSTRGARYALRRSVEPIGSQWPVYRIDEDGAPHELGLLYALERNHYYAAGGPRRIAGLVEGVPYYLQDARPAGFLGRAIPSAFPELALPARVTDWTDDHFLSYLARRGSNTTGDLIVGAESLDRHLAGSDGPRVIAAADRDRAYPALALAALAGAPPGSSAQGEWPKFAACLAVGQRRTHVIVKFSPPRTTATGERFADLLTCEHLAHRVLGEHGVAACRSELIEAADRAFLECERFDRAGAAGRLGAVSLFALDSARYGRLDNWTAAAERLTFDALLPTDDARRLRLLDAFGALIANTDRHFANVTLFDRYEGPFMLAPAYDMLPMLFAPQGEQLIDRQYIPPAPKAAWLDVWGAAVGMAENYWARLAHEPRLSAGFRTLAAQCLGALPSAL